MGGISHDFSMTFMLSTPTQVCNFDWWLLQLFWVRLFFHFVTRWIALYIFEFRLCAIMEGINWPYRTRFDWTPNPGYHKADIKREMLHHSSAGLAVVQRSMVSQSRGR